MAELCHPISNSSARGAVCSCQMIIFHINVWLGWILVTMVIKPRLRHQSGPITIPLIWIVPTKVNCCIIQDHKICLMKKLQNMQVLLPLKTQWHHSSLHEDKGVDLLSMPKKSVRELVFVKSEFIFTGSNSPVEGSTVLFWLNSSLVWLGWNEVVL